MRGCNGLSLSLFSGNLEKSPTVSLTLSHLSAVDVVEDEASETLNHKH